MHPQKQRGVQALPLCTPQGCTPGWVTGFEPATPGSTDQCSAIELHPPRHSQTNYTAGSTECKLSPHSSRRTQAQGGAKSDTQCTPRSAGRVRCRLPLIALKQPAREVPVILVNIVDLLGIQGRFLG